MVKYFTNFLYNVKPHIVIDFLSFLTANNLSRPLKFFKIRPLPVKNNLFQEASRCKLGATRNFPLASAHFKLAGPPRGLNGMKIEEEEEID